MKFSVEKVHIILLISIISYGVDGSKTENKPSIKSFKKHGDIIDCVDIYKQPAFDHPLLKNHELQRRPSSVPKPSKPITSTKTRSRVGLRGEVEAECPHGTVPIRRTHTDDFLRAYALRKRSLHAFRSPKLALATGIHYAAVTTPVNDPSLQFSGAKSTISVYNSTVDAFQLTEAMLWIGSGVDGAYNSIEYGWTINPQLYGDHEPRTYSLWTADGQQNTGCFNAVCPGYVQVSRKRIMGEVNKQVTVFGESVYAMEFSIFKDADTGNWWLVENLGDKKGEPVGYWPKELFPSMRDFAKVVQLGGKVYNPPNISKRTPMGSGTFIPDDFTRTCYVSNIAFVQSDYMFHAPKDVPLSVTADVPGTYKAVYLGDVSKDHPQRGYTLLFGGPNVE